MLRYRGSKSALSQVRELDAFPKIPESYSETSARGGAISIVTFIGIAILVVSEIKFFLDTRLKFKYEVDVNYNEKVWLNFDITVATHCKLIGADVVDATGQAWVFTEGMSEKSVTFSLSHEEEAIRESLLKTKEVLLGEDDGTKVSEIAIKRGFNATKVFFEKPRTTHSGPPDSCRFYGNVLVNKVSGNFHIIAGKSLPLRGGHAHLSFFADGINYNFSHRINHFSFGDMKVGFINVLDGDEHITDEERSIFHYYLDAVSTRINSRRMKTHTYQFSVSEQARVLDHSSGSHGTAGIFFKYGFSPLAVTIEEHSMPLGRFFVRLCGIVGGLFATSGIINMLAGIASDALRKPASPRRNGVREDPPSSAKVSLLSDNALPPVNSPVLN